MHIFVFIALQYIVHDNGVYCFTIIDHDNCILDSTASSSLNAMAAVTWEDLLKWKFYYLEEHTQATIAKIIGKYQY